MKKTLITTVIIIGCLGAQTFANDCSTVQGNEQSLITRYEGMTEYHKFLSKEGFITIISNLKAYCCSQNLIECSENEKANLPEKNYPESPYMFDHLIDMTMRRLDGIPSLAYGKDVDPMAKFRRETIDAIAADPTGAQAMTVEDKFATYRSLDRKKTKNIKERVLPNYDTTNTELLSLADKYNKLCEINKLLYKDIQDNQSIIVGEYSESNSFYRKCETMVRERIQRETQYTKLLMIQKSTQMLTETTKEYTKTHFVEEKLMGLRNLITKVKDFFQTIVQQAPASKVCN